MSNREILDLTNNLSQALDQNYNVVNMDVVISVISSLEGTTITKEQLEATRLAKYINHLRRRTNNENLARRAKSLLKKWREMVGMQQASGDSQQQMQSTSPGINSAIVPSNTDSLLISSNLQSSQSTSPANRNNSENVGLRADYARGVALNVASSVSNVARGLSLDAYNKRLDTSENQKITGSRATLDNSGRMQNQPISFSNLIKNLENSNCANRAHADTDYKSFSQDPKANNHNMRTETLVIDHSSNSNSKSNTELVSQSKVEEVPIVIDSDSGESDRNLITNNSKASLTMSTEHNFTVFNVKVKKSKKEKKRRDRDNQNKIDGTTKNSVITLNDRSIAQISQNKKASTVNTTENDIFSNVKEIKLHPTMSNMSEILSLSNSSMSSIFPSENNISLSARHRNTAVDLSFAGKFKANNVAGINSGATVTEAGPASVNGRDGPTYISDSSNMESKQTKLQDKSMIVNESSSSSSRAFPFDMIDVVTQDNNQSNLEELLHNNILVQHIASASDVVEDHNTGETQRSTDLIDITVNAPPLKVQKKRGRKKGSKGVDAIIAHETSLSQQIFGSGSKKVKTTKELFNEIQNKKLCLAPSSSSGYTMSSSQKCTYITSKLQNQKLISITSRPASSCSEPSLHSPHTMDAYLTNATVSTGATRSSPDNISNAAEEGPDTDSDTMTSELSHDGLKMRLLSRASSTDSNSISECVSTSGKLNLSNISLAPKDNNVDIQLKQLVDHLPVPETANIIEEKYLTQLVPCTCILVEEVPKAELAGNAISSVDSENGNFIVGGSSDVVISVQIDNKKDKNTHHTESTKSIISDKADISSLQKPKKSIFDLDFDEEDDPLQTLLTESLGAGSQNGAVLTNEANDGSNEETGNTEICEDKTNTHGQIIQQDEKNTDIMVPFRMYRIVEDENCEAKQRYNIQTNKITKFHINALHNYFIPNVNGNWDDVNRERMNDQHLNYKVTDGSDVVPQYGSLITECIPKDLSKLLFKRDLRISKMQFKNVPFLGVAKCLPTCRKQKKNIKKVNNNFKREKLDGVDTKLKIIKSIMSLTNENLPADNRSDETEYDINDLNGNPTAIEVNLANISNTKKPEFSDQNRKNENTHKQKDDFTSHDLLAIVKLPDSHSSSYENELKSYNANMAMIKSCSRRSSSCSSSSLKRTQNSINKRLRNQRLLYNQKTLEQEECDYNAGDGKSVKRRKKKRKKIRPDFQDRVNGSPSTEISRQRIKRIKIAINGDIATQKHVSFIGDSKNNSTDDDSLQFSNNSDKTDGNENYFKQGDKLNDSDYFEKESLLSFTTVDSNATEEAGAPNVDYRSNNDDAPITEKSNNDEYAIVQRPMGGSSNHIVLTIKKTPNKTNSPANSNSAMPPCISSVNGILRTDSSASHSKKSRISLAPLNSEFPLSKIRTKACNLSERFIQQVNEKNKSTGRKCRRRRHQKTYEPQLDIELKHIFRDRVTTLSAKNQEHFDQRKTHHKLFFPDELYMRNDNGKQSRILNCSSCDSSCADGSEYEYFSSSSVLSDTVQSQYHLKFIHSEKCDSNILAMEDSSSSTNTTSSEEIASSEDINKILKSSNDFDDGRKSESKTQPDLVENKNELELELENNGLLPSFNAVDSKRQSVVSKEGSVVELQLPYKNCDDYNKYTNNNNLNIFKYNIVNNIDGLKKENITNSDIVTSLSTKESMIHNQAGHNEFQTGIRNVDINVTNDSVEMHTRVQQFKEWHQVLQLQSYNNELLTVLPYVLLE